MDLAIAIFKEVWQEQLNTINSRKAEHQRQLNHLEHSIGLYVTELVTTKVPEVKSELEKRINMATGERSILTAKLNNLAEPHADFEKILEGVQSVLTKPKKYWFESELEGKQAIQRVTFPEGLIYDEKEEKFRKPQKALIYAFLEDISVKKTGMVGPAGLEPATDPL